MVTIGVTILPLNPNCKGCNVNYEFEWDSVTYQRHVYVSYGEVETLMDSYATAFAAAVKTMVDAAMPAIIVAIQATYPNYPNLTPEEWDDYNQDVADARASEEADAIATLSATMPTGEILPCFAEIGKAKITEDLKTIAKYWTIVKTFADATFNVTV